MKDKEMIEEMAKVIEYAKGSVETWHCRDTNCEKCEYKRCKNSAIAEHLYEQGYRKLTDSVVLSKEEYEELQVGKDFDYGYHEGYKNTEAYYKNIELPKASKETAEKFARDIFNHITTPEVWEKLRMTWLNIDGNFNANKHIYDLLIEPVAKQFGVEIKE